LSDVHATSDGTVGAERPRRRWHYWLAGIVAGVVLLWCAIWLAAYWAANAAIDRATATRLVNCTDRALGGFPLRLSFLCNRGAATDGLGVSAELSGIRASAPLYWPGYIEAAVTGPLVLNDARSGLALTSSWTRAGVYAEAGLGGMTRFGASLLGFNLESKGGDGTLPVNAVTATSGAFAIAPGADRSFSFVLSGRDIKVDTSERSYPELDGEVRLTALGLGRTLGFDPGETVMAWLARGGTVRIERLRFASGGSSLGATGELALSPEGLLSGRLTLEAGGIDRLPDVVETFLPGSRDRVEQVVAVLAALPEGDGPDGPVRKLPLRITDGNVAFGIIPLGSIPPIRF
jgi:hypothetical protein